MLLYSRHEVALIAGVIYEHRVDSMAMASNVFCVGVLWTREGGRGIHLRVEGTQGCLNR